MRIAWWVHPARNARGVAGPCIRCVGGRRQDDRGAVLIAVMLIMVVLLGMGMTGLFLTKSNVQMLTNTNLRNQALYVAEAGLERARDVLNGPVSPDLPALLGGTGHVANPADEIPGSLDPVYNLPVGRGAILTDASGAALFKVNYPTSIFHGEAVPGNPDGVSASLMGSYTVYIRNDTAECRKGKYTIDGKAANGNQIVVIRSEGTALDGQTSVALEMTMGAGSSGEEQGTGGIASVLCNSGKNSCDDNNSVQNNVVINN
jgi:hypothetical protein